MTSPPNCSVATQFRPKYPTQELFLKHSAYVLPIMLQTKFRTQNCDANISIIPMKTEPNIELGHKRFPKDLGPTLKF
jgi:hypothetical protein